MHMLTEGHETPRRKLAMFVVTRPGTADHVVPFQTSIRASAMDPWEAVPTAMHDVPDAHETL